MATRPSLHVAVAKTKNKASEYNDNFDMMMDYIDASLGESKDYVDAYMPSVSGQSGKFLTNNGTTASWATLASQPFGQFINGLILTKSSDDTIAVSAGSCYDSTGAIVLTLGSDTTKQNESQTASTTYYVYIIGNGTTTDILITTSSSNPTLPTGFTNYRKLGSYQTDSNSKIIASTIQSESSTAKQDGSWVVSESGVLFSSTAKGSYTMSLSDYLPNDGAVYEVLFNAHGGTTANSIAYLQFKTILNSTVSNFYVLMDKQGGSADGGYSADAFIVPIQNRTISLQITNAAFSALNIKAFAYKKVG